MLNKEQLTFDTTTRTCDRGSIFRFAKNASVAPVTCHMSHVNCTRASRGFGLVEILVAASILSMSMLAVSTFFQSTLKMSRATGDGNQTSYLLEEGVEALKIMRDTSYANNFFNVSTSTPRYFDWSYSTSSWAATTTDILIDNEFERKFTIGDVFRDNTTFDISTSTTGVTYDPNVKLATVKVTWLSGSAGAGKLTPLSPSYLPFPTTGGCNGGGGVGIEISPDGKYVYALEQSAGKLYMMARNTTTGTLSLLSPSYVDTGGITATSSSMVMSSDGKYVYIANRGTGAVIQYSRDANTGLLATPGTSYSGVSYATGLALSPDGKTLYAINHYWRDIYKFTRNTTDGTLSSLVDTGVNSPNCPEQIGVSADGKSVYALGSCESTTSSFRSYTRNTSTGGLSSQVYVPISGGINPVAGRFAISPDSSFVYLSNYSNIVASSSISMYRRNLTTGELTLLSPERVDASTGARGIIVSSDGFFVYVAAYFANTVSQYARNITTGQLTTLSPRDVSSPGIPFTPIISPDGASLYMCIWCSARVNQYSRDPGLTVRTIQTYITNLFNN